MLRALFFSVVALLAVSPLQAQDERWQVTLDPEEYVWDVRLVRLDGDSLVVREADTLRALSIERVAELRLIRKTEVRLGEGAAGGAMSALSGSDDEVYDLRPLEFADRIRAVQEILRYRPTEP